MFHLCAYTASIAQNTLVDVTALADDVLSRTNSHFTLDRRMDLICAAVMSANLDRVQIASPSMRQVVSPWVRPIIQAVQPPDDPAVWVLRESPFALVPYEEIQVQAFQSGAGAERFTALLWLMTSQQYAPTGNVIPWRWTSTTAAVANTWTSLTVTFADSLPSGAYAIVGTDHFSTNAQAHRWIVPNQLERPGMLSYATDSARHPYVLTVPPLGHMGTFRSNNLPIPQVLCNGADAVHEGYLYIIRLGGIG